MLDANVFGNTFDAVFARLKEICPTAKKTYALSLDPKSTSGQSVILTPASDGALDLTMATRASDKMVMQFVVSVFDRKKPNDDCGQNVALLMTIANHFSRAVVGQATCNGVTIPTVADGQLMYDSSIYFGQVVLSLTAIG